MLNLSTPYKVIFSKKYYIQQPAFIWLHDNTYHILGGIHSLDICPTDDNYYTLTGDLAIPFIVYHNWWLEGSISRVKNSTERDEKLLYVLKENIIDIGNAYNIIDIVPEIATYEDPDVAYIYLAYMIEKYLLPHINKK